MYVICAFICFLTFAVLAYITYKVIKKVGSTDKIIPAMLIMLQLSAIGKYHSIALSILKIKSVDTNILIRLGFGLFFIYCCYTLRLPDDFYPNTCYAAIAPSISTLFLALAVFLNINKWIYFTLRIQANINIREYEIAEMVAED